MKHLPGLLSGKGTYFLTAGAAILFLLVSCATVPLTERRAIHLVSEQELTTLSLQEYSKILKDSKLSTDPANIQMVKNVGARIARATEELLKDQGRADEVRNYKWEFNLIQDDKTVNAWCMPGGKVAVYTGILPVTQTETGLAVVMGHEIAHAIARHGAERMSQGAVVELGGAAVGAVAGQYGGAAMAAYGLGAQLGVMLPFSRSHEQEADTIGLMLMARAGYDPRGALAFWDRMEAQAGGASSSEFLSTHPSYGTRRSLIAKAMPEALQYYAVAPHASVVSLP